MKEQNNEVMNEVDVDINGLVDFSFPNDPEPTEEEKRDAEIMKMMQAEDEANYKKELAKREAIKSFVKDKHILVILTDKITKTINLKVKTESVNTTIRKQATDIGFELWNSLKENSKKVRFSQADKFIIVPMSDSKAIDKTLNSLQLKYGKKISDLFNIYKETVEAEEIEEVEDFYSIIDEETVTELDKVKKEAILNQMKKEKSKREKETLGAGVASFEDEKVDTENVVAWFFRVKGDRYIVDARTDNICSMYEPMKAYKALSFSELKIDVSVLMQQKFEETNNQAFKNMDTDTTHEKIAKTAKTTAKGRAIVNGLSIDGSISLSEEFWGFYIRTAKGRVPVHARVEKHPVTGNYKFMIYKADFKNYCQKYIETVELPINQVFNLNGENVEVLDFDSVSKYYYEVNYNISSELEKWVLNDMFEDDQFKRLYRNYIGAMFLGEEYQKILVVYGEGRDGKSMLINMLARILPKQFIDTAVDFTSGDKFSMADIQLYHFLSQSELKSTGFDEKLVKRVSGGDTYSTRGLYKEASKVRSGKVSMVLHGNSSDMFTFSDTGTSTIERYFFTKVKAIENRKQKARIVSLDNYLINGGVLDDKQVSTETIEFKGGALFDLLNFFMAGALEHKELRTPIISDYGDKVVAYQRECFGKMMTRVGFMTDYEVNKSEKEGVLLEDYYNEFLKATNKQAKQYSKKLFENDINKGFREKYGTDYKREYVRIEEYNQEGEIVVRKHIALGLTVEGLPLKTYKFNEVNKMSVQRLAKESMIENFMDELSEKTLELTNNKETISAFRELIVNMFKSKTGVNDYQITDLADRLSKKVAFKLYDKEKNTTAVKDMMNNIMSNMKDKKELFDRVEKIKSTRTEMEIEDVTDWFLM